MVQVHLGPRTFEKGHKVKKFFSLIIVAIVGLVAFKEYSAKSAESDLWTQATSE